MVRRRGRRKRGGKKGGLEHVHVRRVVRHQMGGGWEGAERIGNWLGIHRNRMMVQGMVVNRWSFCGVVMEWC